jgi:hypothetical protein
LAMAAAALAGRYVLPVTLLSAQLTWLG